MNKKQGFELLVTILQNGELPFVKEKVNNKIIQFSGKDFGYDTMNTNIKNKEAIDKIIAWINTL